MNKTDETIIFDLKQATALQARIVLEELEEDPKRLLSFCKFAKEADVLTASKICRPLSTLNTRPSIELLVHFAQSTDDTLRKEAFKGLRATDAQSSQKYVLPLLHIKDSDICSSTIEVLCHYGIPFDVSHIRRVLQSSSDTIVLLMLNSISKLHFNANDEIKIGSFLISSISHHDDNIRKQSAVLLKNLPIEKKHLGALLEQLKKEKSDEIRVELCTVLARHKVEGARVVLERMVYKENESFSLRRACVNALSNYPSAEVIRSLIELMSQPQEYKLKSVCIQALGAMPEDMLLHITLQVLQDSDKDIRIIALELAGLLALPETEKALYACWQREKDSSVILTAIEVAGRAGFKSVWDLAVLELSKDELVSYTAIQTLSAILTDDKVVAFSAILETEQEHSIYETILDRLVFWGKSHKLPNEIAPRISDKLWHPYINIKLLACRVASLLHDTNLSLRMFDVIKEETQQDMLKALSAALLSQNKESLTLLCDAFPKHINEIEIVILSAPLLEVTEDVLIYFAKKSAFGQHVSTLLLAALAKRNLAPFVTLLASDLDMFSIALIDAWVLAPFTEQLKHPLPLQYLLQVPRKRVRQVALLHPPRLIDSSIFASILDASLFDEDKAVRTLATHIVSANFKQAQNRKAP